jgi:calcineurin-like phosphoesterase family protein
MNYFTSDWHLGETRIGIDGKPNLFYRPFQSVREQNDSILLDGIESANFADGDTLWHLGDVLFDPACIDELRDLKADFPNSRFLLVEGNYDTDKMDQLLEIFELAPKEVEIKGRKYFLDHYPANCVDKEFSLTGHIHGLWKVQKNMINVGVDAWHFRPVSEDEIDFCRTACEKYYDSNVFPF